MSDESGGGTGCILFLPVAIIAGLFDTFKSIFDHNPKHKRKYKSRRRYISSRRRGTAIVDTKQGILVTAGRKKVFYYQVAEQTKVSQELQPRYANLEKKQGLKLFMLSFYLDMLAESQDPMDTVTLGTIILYV